MPSARACRIWSGFSSEIETERLYLIAALDELSRMWSGFSSEIETLDITTRMQSSWGRMWSGFSSEIETLSLWVYCHSLVCRMWSGFSSEIETHHGCLHDIPLGSVACGAASRLRLKQTFKCFTAPCCCVACGAASRLRLKRTYVTGGSWASGGSHVERLL